MMKPLGVGIVFIVTALETSTAYGYQVDVCSNHNSSHYYYCDLGWSCCGPLHCCTHGLDCCGTDPPDCQVSCSNIGGILGGSVVALFSLVLLVVCCTICARKLPRRNQNRMHRPRQITTPAVVYSASLGQAPIHYDQSGVLSLSHLPVNPQYLPPAYSELDFKESLSEKPPPYDEVQGYVNPVAPQSSPLSNMEGLSSQFQNQTDSTLDQDNSAAGAEGGITSKVDDHFDKDTEKY